MTITCAACGRDAPNDGRGLCHTCRVRLARQGRLAAYPRYCVIPGKRAASKRARLARRCRSCKQSVMRGSCGKSNWNKAWCLICETKALFSEGDLTHASR